MLDHLQVEAQTLESLQSLCSPGIAFPHGALASSDPSRRRRPLQAKRTAHSRCGTACRGRNRHRFNVLNNPDLVTEPTRASESSIPVSIVSLPGYRMGELAIELLLEEIHQRSGPPPRTVMLDPHLIPRRSTLRPHENSS